jgi:hypothetical protein
MMENPQIPQDDLMDVLEMTRSLENYLSHLLKENELDLAFSAIMSATVNSIIAQCKTLDQLVFYRNHFMQTFDHCIWTMQLQKPEPPS